MNSLDADRKRLYDVLKSKGNGSILRGWRQMLDKEGVLRVGFQDFCKAMANTGVQVDAVRLFQQDGMPQSFALEDLAPVEASLLQKFRQWVQNTFEGPSGMFAAFDPDNTECITREAFIENLKSRKFMAYEADVQELFNCLDFDNGGSVTMDEIIFLELDPVIRDQEIFKLKIRSKFERQRVRAYAHWEDGQRYPSMKHRRSQRPWMAQAFENLPVFVCRRRLQRKEDQYSKAAKARSTFLRELVNAYGNEVRAWRRGLDLECAFRVSRRDLRRFCRERDLNMDFRSLWHAMDKDGDGQVSLEELNSTGAFQLATFRSWAHENFGSCAKLWDLPEMIEKRKSKHSPNGFWASDKKMLTWVFSDIVQRLGWKMDPGSVLFQSLDMYGCGFISLPDLWWLDAWIPPEWLVAHPDPDALLGLQNCVHSIYTHPLIAWRAALDLDSDNLVSWVEFQSACRKLKFDGSIGGAWRCLDVDVSGTITLREWDPVGAELLGSFKGWAEAHFGSVELAFKAIDKDGSGSITLSDLKQACRRLKWDGDVRLLVQCLGIKGAKDENKAKSLMASDISFIDNWVDMVDYKGHNPSLDGQSRGSVGGRRLSSRSASTTW